MAEREPKSMNVKAIKKIMTLMKKQGVTDLDIEQEGVKIRIKRGTQENSPVILSTTPHMVQNPAAPPLPPTAASPAVPVVPSESAAPSATSTPAGEEGLVAIFSPMVGTFYASTGPDAPPYVTVGDTIKEGQTLCIIEAMKLMNEIKAEAPGKVVKVLAENGQPVEYNQKLFLIEPLKV